MSTKPREDSDRPAPPDPVDMSNGIPDCRTSASRTVIVLLVAVFVSWCIFLLYCQYGGRV
jgi:hypothetical protein